jgi:hypothetical protein
MSCIADTLLYVLAGNLIYRTLGIPAMDLAKRFDLVDGMYKYVLICIVYQAS